MTRNKKETISILNWMGTLLLCAIPGVNALFVICTLIFAKSAAKKNFAWAMLIWAVLCAVIVIAILAIFPDEVLAFSAAMRDYAAQASTSAH